MLDCLFAEVEAFLLHVRFFFFLSGSALKAVGLNLLLLKISRHLSVLHRDNLKKKVFKIPQSCTPTCYGWTDEIKHRVEIL